MILHLKFTLTLVANFLYYSLALEIVEFEGRYYSFDHSRAVTWDEAYNICMDRGLQIASPRSKSVNNFLKQHVQNTRGCWLSLTSMKRIKVDNPQIKKLYDLSWFAPPREVIYTDWCTGDSKRMIEGIFLSVVLSQNRRCWDVVDPQSTACVICETTTAKVKPTDQVEFEEGTFNFYDIRGVSFFEAYKICNANDQKMVYIDTEELSNELNLEVQKRHKNYWLGLKNFDQYGLSLSKWHWNSTQRRVRYKNWCPPTTSDFCSLKAYKYEWCAYLKADERCWKTEECDIPSDEVDGFICSPKQGYRRPAPKTTKKPITEKPTTKPSNYFQVLPFNGVNFYFYENNTVSQSEANVICRKNGQNLATFDNVDKMTFLQLQTRKRMQNYWIGLEAYIVKQMNEEYMYWKWNNTGIDTIFQGWCPNQNPSKQATCAFAAYPNACWAFTTCDVNKHISGFICEDRLNHTDKYDIVNYNTFEYHIFKNTLKTFQEAKVTCMSMGKQLLTLDSYEKIEFFNTVLAHKAMSFWLGLEGYIEIIANNKYLFWKWIALGQDITIGNWCKDNVLQEETLCAYIQSTSECWRATTCSSDKVEGFICEDKNAAIPNPNRPATNQHYLAINYLKGHPKVKN